MLRFLCTTALVAAATAAAQTVKLTPWCENSVRIQVTPAAGVADAGLDAERAKLQRVLKEQGLKELPGARRD